MCLLPDDKVKSSLLIVEKISNLLFCHTCDDGSILNLKDQTNVNKEHCTHTFVANTLMENSDKTSFDVADKDNIFVVQENPYYVAVVYPSKERQDSKLRPGMIMKTARMTKTRCRTCKGRDNCFHLNVLKQAETEKAANENCRSGRLAEQAKKKTNVETDMLGGLAYKKENPKGKSKSKNENNPENFHGDAANVFGQQFQYPPTTADKEKNNKINKVIVRGPQKQCSQVSDVQIHKYKYTNTQIQLRSKLQIDLTCAIYGTRTSKTMFPSVGHANTQIQLHKYTNTVWVKFADRSNMCYIFEKVMVRGPQKK